jgi:hypothetical protein
MLEETFSIHKAWAIDPPCYARKVDRLGHCRDAAAIQSKVLCPDLDSDTISVFEIASAVDLARVAIALNANRSSKTESLFLLALTAGELVGFVVRSTTGATLCKWANHLHRDLVVKGTSQTADLAHALAAAGRKPAKFPKTAMKEALVATADAGCYAAVADSMGCVCESDLPASISSPWLRILCRALRRACRDVKTRVVEIAVRLKRRSQPVGED